MLGIVFTTPHEAVPFLDAYDGTRPDALELDAPVHSDNLLIAATGRGKINATLTVERLLDAYDLDVLIHAGACTGLDEEVPIGSVMGAAFAVEGDRVELENPVYPRMPLECPLDVDSTGTLVSREQAARASVESTGDAEAQDELSYWERLADARDETGYAIAYVAAQHGTACHIIKGVSTHINTPPDAIEDASTRTAVATTLQAFLTDSAEAS